MTLELSLQTECNGEDCAQFLTKWNDWCRVRQGATLAMLPVSTTDQYMQQTLGAKSRNMVRKAQRSYYFSTFRYNDHLDEIYKINTSTPHRQGKPMSAAYTTRPKPMTLWRLCMHKHHHIFVGGFTVNNTLKAYCNLAILGDVAIINQILGHVDDLPDGIMNGLINYVVDYLSKWTKVQYINYLDLTSCSVGMARFKSSVGFEPQEVHFGV